MMRSREASDALVAEDVQRAAQMFDLLSEDERRSLVLNIYTQVAKYSRTGDIDHLKNMAESVEVTVRLRSNADVQQGLAFQSPIKHGEEVDVAEVVKILRE